MDNIFRRMMPGGSTEDKEKREKKEKIIGEWKAAASRSVLERINQVSASDAEQGRRELWRVLAPVLPSSLWEELEEELSGRVSDVRSPDLSVGDINEILHDIESITSSPRRMEQRVGFSNSGISRAVESLGSTISRKMGEIEK